MTNFENRFILSISKQYIFQIDISVSSIISSTINSYHLTIYLFIFYGCTKILSTKGKIKQVSRCLPHETMTRRSTKLQTRARRECGLLNTALHQKAKYGLLTTAHHQYSASSESKIWAIVNTALHQKPRKWAIVNTALHQKPRNWARVNTVLHQKARKWAIKIGNKTLHQKARICAS